MKRKQFIANLLTISSAVIFLFSAGCASSPKGGLSQRDLSKTVAKILAKNAAASLTFKDVNAANEITASISETEQLKFAVLLEPDLKAFSKYFGARFDGDKTEIMDAIQNRVRGGSVEFSFEQNGLSVSVVPVRAGDQLCGYAAVGSL